MVSSRGIALIKKWESCRLQAYDDGTGTWTIGWGHTAGVKQGDTCTQEQADAWLAQEVVTYNNAVRAYHAQYIWTQNEEDALTSFSYNLGTGSIAQVTANGTRSKSVIAEKMLLYVNAGGKYMEGLANRRKEEVALFRSTSPSTGDDGGSADLPSSDGYFPKYDEYDAKIDQIMRWIGADKYYTDAHTWRKRLPIAQANGMPNYSGKSTENRDLVRLAMAGALRKPS